MIRRIMGLLTTLCLIAPFAAAQEKGLVAHYTFDERQGDTVRDLSGQGNHGKIVNAEFVKSPRGSALRFDAARRSHVVLGSNAVLNIAGDMTVELWVKLTGDTSGDKFLFGDTASLAVNRNFYVSACNKRLRMEHGNGKSVEQLLSDGEVFTGEWQHVALVCEYPRYYMYVDGALHKTDAMSLPIIPTEITPRHLGGWWYEPGYLTGELDEVRVYARALSDAEIRRHAGSSGTAGRTEVCAVMPRLHYPLGRLEVSGLALGIGDGMTAEVTVAPKGKDPVLRKSVPLKETRLESHRADVRADLPAKELVPGEYVVALAVSTPKAVVARGEADLVVPAPPEWLDSAAGVSDDVLPPYTPIRRSAAANGLRFEVWGRTYEFGPGPVVTSVTSQAKPLLAGPARLAARADGKALRFVPSPCAVAVETPARVELRQTTAASGLSLHTETLLEYDGFTRIKLRLIAERATTLDAFVLELPLDPTVTRYQYTWSNVAGPSRNGFLPPDGMRLPFCPLLWLGDDEKGLSWFAESDEHWAPAEAKAAIEIAPGATETVLRLNLVGRPTRLEPMQEVVWEFGLQATPLKPIERDHYDLRMHHISQTTHGPAEWGLKIPDAVLDTLAAKGVRTICFHEHWTPFQGYTKTPHEADLRSLVDRCHARGMKLLLYFGYNISDLIPEWPWIGEDCVLHPKCGYLPLNYPPQPIQNAYIVCLNSVYQDLLADGIARLLERFDIDGVYLDTTVCPSGCTNALHGCGYRKADGLLAPTYPVFAVREMLRRMYTLVRAHRPDGQVDAHVFDGMNAPALAFATSYWTGEQLHKAEFPPDGLPLDRFRAEFMGRNWGVPAQFLHYCLGSYRTGWAFAILHDVTVRSAGLGPDLDLESSVWKAMDAFDRKGAEWIPYWRAQDVMTVRPEGVVASAYRHPKNGVLLAVSNLGRDRVEAQIALNVESLGLRGPLVAQDALTGAAVEMRGTGVVCPMNSIEWRLIRVSAKE